MRSRSVVVSILCLLAGASAHAQYLLSPRPGPNGGNGAQLQIGHDFPFPASSGVYLGGQTSVNGGTLGMGAGYPIPNPDGPGPTWWPPLLIRRNPASMGTIMQGLSTSQGGAIALPPGVLTNQVGSAPRAPIGVALQVSYSFYQVRTSADLAWPAATATLAPGGGPGIPSTTLVLSGPGGGTIAYTAGTKSFGGAAEFSIVPGPFAGTVKVPPAGTMGSKLPVLSVWYNHLRKLNTVFQFLLLGASNPDGVGAPGQSLAAAVHTTMFGPVPLAIRRYTGPCCIPYTGMIELSMTFGSMEANVTNPLTGSKGFPWTTGFISVTAPGAALPDVFFLSGRDDRVAGVGNISLVSGALSKRKITGSNANRGWVTLTIPEPAAALGAAAALAVLALCHALVRRR